MSSGLYRKETDKSSTTPDVTSTSNSDKSRRPDLKTKKSTGGWNWPRLVNVADKQDAHNTSPSASTSKVAQKSINIIDSTSPLEQREKEVDMPAVKENVDAEVGDVTGSSARTNSASSVETTPHRQIEEPHESNASTGVETRTHSSGGSESSCASCRSAIESHGHPQVEDSDASVCEAQKANDSNETSDVSQDKTVAAVNTTRHGLESTADDHNTESNASKVSSAQRISIAEPLPVPRILVQVPSEASEIREDSSKVTTPRPATRPIEGEPRDSFEQARARLGQEIAGEIAKISPRPTSAADAQVGPKTLRPKKSAIALRKTRNACIRQTFLKALLGRELAAPTKMALRKRARGELIIVEDISVLEVVPAGA